MELTRLKRYLREGGAISVFVQALSLLDALDVVRETADEYEDCLVEGDAPTEKGMGTFVADAADQLVETLVALPSVGTAGILTRMSDETGVKQLFKELFQLRREQHEQSQPQEAPDQQNEEDLLGELDDHPF